MLKKFVAVADLASVSHLIRSVLEEVYSQLYSDMDEPPSTAPELSEELIAFIEKKLEWLETSSLKPTTVPSCYAPPLEMTNGSQWQFDFDYLTKYYEAFGISKKHIKYEYSLIELDHHQIRQFIQDAVRSSHKEFILNKLSELEYYLGTDIETYHFGFRFSSIPKAFAPTFHIDRYTNYEVNPYLEDISTRKHYFLFNGPPTEYLEYDKPLTIPFIPFEKETTEEEPEINKFLKKFIRLFFIEFINTQLKKTSIMHLKEAVWNESPFDIIHRSNLDKGTHTGARFCILAYKKVC